MSKRCAWFRWGGVLALAWMLSLPSAAADADAGWQLVFHDDFARDELGPDWKIVAGDWRLEDGLLIKRHIGHCGEMVITRRFPGRQRVVIEAVAHGTPGDLSPILHTRPERIHRAGGVNYLLTLGYFFQFGGRGNTINVTRRLGEALHRDDTFKIEPGRVHRVVAEADGERLRLKVDGRVLHDIADAAPLSGPDHEHVGLYISRDGALKSIRVYTRAAPGAAAPPPPEDAVQAWLEAARAGDRDAIAAGLAAGMPVDACDAIGWTALLFAAEAGQTEVVRLLLEAGADPRGSVRGDSWTALTRAARMGHADAVQLLIQAGADINHAHGGDWTAMREAQLGAPRRVTPHIDVIQHLREAGAKDSWGY